MEIDCNKLYIYAASTLALHFAPIKWIASFYGYHKICRLYLLYAQQGVFAITFITRSSALYFSYTDLLVTKDVKGEFVDEHVQNSRLEYICFVFAAISIGLCEAISMDSTILSEKHIYNLPYTLQRIRVTCVKYYGLCILCHLHFYNTRGSYWITAFDNSQRQNIFYEWEIRKLTFLWMIGCCFVQYLIFQPLVQPANTGEITKINGESGKSTQDSQPSTVKDAVSESTKGQKRPSKKKID